MLLAAMVLASGCSGQRATKTDENASAESSVFIWPGSLNVVGDGFPTPDAPCRRLGESAATIDFLDDRKELVGCPTRLDAEKLGGQILKAVDGVTLVSVHSKNALTISDKGDDALVPGTTYHATAQISCAGYKGNAVGRCDAGVIRSEDGITIEVMLANGTKRIIFFNPDGSFLTFSTAEADGTAAMAMSARKKGDITIAKLGTEIYEIPDAFVIGG